MYPQDPNDISAEMGSDPVEYLLDYDWLEANSSYANATLTVRGDNDEQAIGAVIAADPEIESSSSADQAVTFVPKTINGEPVGPKIREFHWVTSAVVNYIRSHPGSRRFQLTGLIE
jgi:hypothetical protein